MSRLVKLIQEFCPNGVEYKELQAVLKIRNGSDYKSFGEGDIPVYGSGGIIAHTNRFAYDKPSVLIPRKGSVDKLYYVDVPFWNVDTIFYTEINTGLVIPRYVYHCLLREHLEKLNTAGGVPSLTQNVLNKVKIPVPPLEVQREIVRILDTFTEFTAELTAKLTAELTARKQQYTYYRDKLLNSTKSHTAFMSLGELFTDVRNGFVGTVTPFFSNKETGILYLRGTNIHNGVINGEDAAYVSKEFHSKHKRTELKPDDIILVQSGHVGDCAVVGENYAGANCHALIVMSNGGLCNSKYIVHYLHSSEGKKKLGQYRTKASIRWEKGIAHAANEGCGIAQVHFVCLVNSSALAAVPCGIAASSFLRQYRTNELVRRRMNFSSDAMADFEGLLEVNRKICKQQMAEKASPTLPTNCAVLP